MKRLILTILYGLVMLAIIVGLYYVALWVFAELAIPVPLMAVKIVFVIIVLVAIIWLVRVLFGEGGPPNWFFGGPGP
jgi:hypothetical protein